MNPEITRWHGKVALVTGASSGVGAAIAESLGAAGLRVVLAGRNQRRLSAVALRIRRHGTVSVVTCDQRRMAENARLFKSIRQRWGGVDVLVNCAGVRGGMSLLDADWEEMQEAITLNVSAALWCARETVTQLRGKPEGAIINICSMVGHRVLPDVPALYAATKHALRILTDGLRTEVAQRKLPIKVTLISPGLTDTPWHRKPGGIARGGRPYPHEPLQPADIAREVLHVLALPAHVQVRDILLSAASQPY